MAKKTETPPHREVCVPRPNPGGTTKPYEKPGNAKLRKAKAEAASKGK